MQLVAQRDVVEVEFDLPQGMQKHCVVVLSCDDAIQLEGCFVGAMITSKEIDDEFSFMLEDFMLTKPMEKKSQVRLHLLGWFHVSDIIENSHYNQRMKIEFFDELVKQINTAAFGVNP